MTRVAYDGGSAAGSAKKWTQRRRTRRSDLESTKKNVMEGYKGLSERQWNFKPAPGPLVRCEGWSMMDRSVAGNLLLIRFFGTVKEDHDGAWMGVRAGRDVEKIEGD